MEGKEGEEKGRGIDDGINLTTEGRGFKRDGKGKEGKEG